MKPLTFVIGGNIAKRARIHQQLACVHAMGACWMPLLLALAVVLLLPRQADDPTAERHRSVGQCLGDKDHARNEERCDKNDSFFFFFEKPGWILFIYKQYMTFLTKISLNKTKITSTSL